jgi:HAD superfamily hydrolase (TIGR01484 family)
MKPLSDAPPSDLRNVQLVLTDMDDTLTFRGRLAAETYTALERLETAGIRVVPVTAAPAGWCDQMVRMWPVSAVIGENGGFCFTRRGTHIERRFWLAPPTREAEKERLRTIGAAIVASLPSARIADDQSYRLTSLAFDRSDEPTTRAILEAFHKEGASTTLNAIWALAWLGEYDKIKAARRFLPTAVGLDVDLDRDRIVFVGDSANDAPMFAHFPKSAGVSTVAEHLSDIPQQPAWITRGAGGSGFVEVADAILAARGTPSLKPAAVHAS